MFQNNLPEPSLWNSQIGRRAFLKKTGAATVGTIVALNGMRLNVLASTSVGKPYRLRLKVTNDSVMGDISQRHYDTIPSKQWYTIRDAKNDYALESFVSLGKGEIRCDTAGLLLMIGAIVNTVDDYPPTYTVPLDGQLPSPGDLIDPEKVYKVVHAVFAQRYRRIAGDSAKDLVQIFKIEVNESDGQISVTQAGAPVFAKSSDPGRASGKVNNIGLGGGVGTIQIESNQSGPSGADWAYALNMISMSCGAWDTQAVIQPAGATIQQQQDGNLLVDGGVEPANDDGKVAHFCEKRARYGTPVGSGPVTALLPRIIQEINGGHIVSITGPGRFTSLDQYTYPEILWKEIDYTPNANSGARAANQFVDPEDELRYNLLEGTLMAPRVMGWLGLRLESTKTYADSAKAE